MNPLIRKELRLVAPAWLAAVAAVIVGTWVFPSSQFILCAAGALLLSLSTFGQEFSHGTFSLLLAQPLERRAVWRTKVQILGIALCSIWSLMMLGWVISSHGTPVGDKWLMIYAVPVYGTFLMIVPLASALWTSLLLKQVAPAFWMAVLIPGFLVCCTSWVFESSWFRSVYPSALNQEEAAILIALAAYCIVAFVAARRLFLTAQDTQWTGGNIGAPVFGRQFLSSLFPRQNAVSALIHKELQLHMVPLFMAAVLTVLSLVAVFTVRYYPRFQAVELVLMFCWFGIPITLGASAVAEERRFNTLEGQLCLPTTKRMQFVIKLTVALLLGTVLGGVLPAIMTRFGGKEVGTSHLDLVFVFSACALSGIITLIVFYASSLTRTLLQSIATAVGVALVSIFIVWFSVIWAFKWINPANYFGNRYLPWVYIFIGSSLLALNFVWSAYKNFQLARIDSAGVRANVWRMFAAFAIFFGVSAAVYGRSWEFFMSCEPKHSVPRLHPGERVKLCAGPAWTSVFVLLPDGRLWGLNKVQLTEMAVPGGRKKPKHTELTSFEVLGGEFLRQTNWLDVAAGFREVYGIQTDGTLWNIDLPRYRGGERTGTRVEKFPPWKTKQVGKDTDWKVVTGASSHWLALKNNGTLWGWGRNEEGQLGSGTNFVSDPIQIGTNSDWTSIFAEDNTSSGGRGDGSFWRWGKIYPFPNGRWNSLQALAKQIEPVRWPISSSPVTSIYDSYDGNYCVTVQEDGKLFAVGAWEPWQETFLGYTPQGGTNSVPQQIGGAEWRSWCHGKSLKRDGTIYMNASWHTGQRCLSKYHDWIAIGGSYDYVALAADGTLCCWPTQSDNPDSINFCLTRRAEWSLNIFNGGR